MKYKIKYITYKNGLKEYEAYVKRWWGWDRLNERIFTSREEALDLIDEHYGYEVQTIKFEYIKK